MTKSDSENGLLETLRALAPVVTPGEWEATVRSGYHEVLAPRPGTNWYDRLDRQAVFYGDTELFDDENAANATAIVTLRNALPAIIAALEVVDLVRDEDWLAERIYQAGCSRTLAVLSARAIIAALPKDVNDAEAN